MNLVFYAFLWNIWIDKNGKQNKCNHIQTFHKGSIITTMAFSKS